MVSRNVTFKTENSDEAHDKYKIAGLESHLKYKDSRVATTGGNYPLPRDRMAYVENHQIQHVSSHPDTGNHTKPPQKKTMFACSAGQMPQNLLNELSTVLNQAGRIPREES